MIFQVLLTNDATRDIEELYDYIKFSDAPEKANYVVGRIERAFLNLSEQPH